MNIDNNFVYKYNRLVDGFMIKAKKVIHQSDNAKEGAYLVLFALLKISVKLSRIYNINKEKMFQALLDNYNQDYDQDDNNLN